jgi:hypothetical protein
MKSKQMRSLFVLLLITAFFVGCQKSTPPVLKEIGPIKTKAGADFNIQPDGVSAIWARTENATDKTVIMWGETKIRTDYKSPTALTAPVPKELYAKSGQYQIYLLDTKTAMKSNSLTFTVEK